MQIEQMMGYQPMQAQRTQERQTTYFVVGDLENLSASVLYSEKLYIKDFSDGSSLHIHENDDKIGYLSIYPNPADGKLVVKFDKLISAYNIKTFLK